VVDDGGERGRNWRGHTRESRVYTSAMLRPGLAVAVAAGLALALGAAGAKSWRT
jgi:hypothetical protein